MKKKIIEGEDHHFSKNDDDFYNLPFEYLLLTQYTDTGIIHLEVISWNICPLKIILKNGILVKEE